MSDALSLEQLQGHFEIPGVVEVAAGMGGLPRVRIRCDLAEADIYLHGAHVTHFQPRGQRPVLFMSRRSRFAAGEPIRGGVPVIFPWFGQRQDGEGPMHGLVRTMNWGVESVEQLGGGEVSVVFALTSDDQTIRSFPAEFVLRYQVTVGRCLEMALRVSNAGVSTVHFEAALHSYFSVGDIHQVRVLGLDGATFNDKTCDYQPARQGPEPLTFTGETDRVYQNTQSTCVIEDPVFGRRIRVHKQGSNTTVVWNPWINKSKALEDFGDDEWPGMLCIETANVREQAVALPAGTEHDMRAVIEVER